MNILKFLLVKPASWIAGRFGGQAAASKVSQIALVTTQKEIRAKKPAILSAIDAAVVGMKAEVGMIVPVWLGYVREHMEDEISFLGLSQDAQNTLGAAIAAVDAPVIAEADKIVESFATAVKAAITAI